MNNLVCEECNKKFRSSAPKQRYCSNSCKSKQPRKIKECGNCTITRRCKTHASMISKYKKEHKPEIPNQIIIDLDNTLCRGKLPPHIINNMPTTPKEWLPAYKYIPKDKVVTETAQLIMAYTQQFKSHVIFLTTRPEQFREATKTWLRKNLKWLTEYDLIMRPEGDWSEDAPLKEELLQTQVLKRYSNIILAMDDSMSNYDMFQRNGIPVLYCGGKKE